MMTIEEIRQHEWVVAWSGGRDSTATIILMHENKIPIKKIVYVRMMYDDELPATLPIMTEFVEKAKARFEAWGYDVEIVNSIKTAKQLAEAIYFKSKDNSRNGKYYGISAFARGHCKFQGIKGKTCNALVGADEFQMIGICADEAERIKRLNGNKDSILVALGFTQQMAFDLCNRYCLLSPLYAMKINRDGCWFCPNAGKKERAIIKQEYPHLYSKIIGLIGMCDYDITNLMPRNSWVRDYFNNKDQMSFEFKEAKDDRD